MLAMGSFDKVWRGQVEVAPNRLGAGNVGCSGVVNVASRAVQVVTFVVMRRHGTWLAVYEQALKGH